MVGSASIAACAGPAPSCQQVFPSPLPIAHIEAPHFSGRRFEICIVATTDVTIGGGQECHDGSLTSAGVAEIAFATVRVYGSTLRLHVATGAGDGAEYESSTTIAAAESCGGERLDVTVGPRGDLRVDLSGGLVTAPYGGDI